MTNNTSAHLCEKDNSVLTIVDIQPKLTAVMPAKVLARLQRNTALLLKCATLLDIPVFATEQYPKGLGELEGDIVKLLPASSKRYEKTAFSCTHAENFTDDLAASKRKQVILVGMEAHICILQTAINLNNMGYQTFIVADAICSRHRESYETALYRLRDAGVVISDAESIVFEWLQDAKHEHFKTLQPLLR